MVGFVRIWAVVDREKYMSITTTMKIHVVKLKQATVITGLTVCGIMGSSALMPANALTFKFTPTAGTSQLAIDGFTAAGSQWSSLFSDNVNVNVNINFTALGAGTLGETSSSSRSYGYDRVYNALSSDRTSADDSTAVNSLSKGSTFNMLLNRTANSPNGAGNATPYLDNNGDVNNKTINITTANAKALGLESNGNNVDASIAFSNLLTWDFNRSDGITTGAFDFVGTAIHEIGHALGFMSGVDILDGTNSTSYYPENQLDYVSPLDLFRYSNDSRNLKAIDWTADKLAKYFSIDGGVTNIAAFSTGDIFGDGRQNSHWQDNLGLGILDPTIAPGELLSITENDKRAFDVIGWNRTVSGAIASNQLAAASDLNNSISAIARAGTTAEPTSVPEPANSIGTLIFTAFGIKMVLKHRQNLLESTQQEAVEEI